MPVVLQRLVEVAPTVSTWPSAARRGGIMAALLAVGAITGHSEAGIAATTGALNIALLDAAVPRAVLARALWLCVATTTVVGFLAVVVGDSIWLIPLLAVLAFLQGALARAGLAVANASIASMITAILFSVVPGSLAEAAVLAGWLCVGAVIETVVALGAWRWERQGLVRRQVGQALAAAARAEPGPEVDRWASAARETMHTAQLCGAERDQLERLLTIAEQPGPQDSASDLRLAGRRLRRVPGSAHGVGRASQAVAALDHVRAEPRDPVVRPTRDRVGDVWGLLRPGSRSFQAGIRLAILMVIGTCLVAYFAIPQGHWVLLVFALAVRADYSGTVAGLIARVIGVMIGVALFQAVAVVSGESLTVLLALAAISGVLTCRWLLGNATLFFSWLTVFVCVLVDIADPIPALGTQRITATAVGAALGLVVAMGWPGWRRQATS